MERNQIIETIGSITKREHLAALQTNILNNSLVLKNVIPFPGITNQNISLNDRAGSLFIILRYRYAPEKINRINAKLRNEMRLSTFPSYGEIAYNKGILPCVRIKELHDFIKILPIQEYLRINDLQLMPSRELDSECRIKIFKSFKLAEIGDGLYRDLHDGEKLYIRINHMLNWKRFDYVVGKIKHTIKQPEFDAALGVIYRFTGPENVIRIFDEDVTFRRAVELRKLFLKEVKDEIHISSVHQQ